MSLKRTKKEKIERRRRRFELRLKNGKYKRPQNILRAKNSLYKKELKANATKAENKFRWIVIKYARVYGYRWIFQKGFFSPFHRIVDYYISSPFNLGVEIDGGSHIGKEEKDRNRDIYYSKERNISFLRITNEQVFNGEGERIFSAELDRLFELRKHLTPPREYILKYKTAIYKRLHV